MTEFNNRIAAQREILVIVNNATWNEELLGLSSGALDRWMRRNGIPESSLLAQLLVEAASKLFFLANKSQEQITDEYKLRSLEVGNLTHRIADVVKLRGSSSIQSP